MKISDLKNRTIKVKAKNKIDMVPRTIESRRDPNFILSEEKHESEYYDDFFDYEEELGSLKPARELARSVVDFDDELVSEKNDIQDKEVYQEEQPGFIIMEESEPSGFIMMEEDSITPKKNKFKQCSYIKENKEQCKRQAPKTSEYCKAHRKMLGIE